jgi:tRNA nucleotidyltransferase (CCA-adding enzyme)
MAVIDCLNLAQIQNICDRFVFTKSDEKRIISCKQKAKKIIKILESQRLLLPSQIYRALEPLSYEAILFIMAKAKSQRAKERISMFFKRYNGVKASIGGKELKALGITPGPAYKRILDRILYDKLDAKIETRQDELNLASRIRHNAT